MDIKLKEINSFSRDVIIDLEWLEIKNDFEKSIKSFSKRIKMPGFRPGKVPRKVLMKQFLPSIEADFVDKSVNTYYLKALKEKEIVPVNMGSVSDVYFHYEEHFKFKVSFEVEPEIKLPRLKKNTLKVEKNTYVIDSVDIQMAIDEVRQGKAEIKTIENGSAVDDYLICDLQEIDDSGVPIIGKKLETRYVKIGQPPFDGENQKKLIGLKPNDTTRVSVPKDGQGLMGIYELIVKNVERQVLPDFDEDFIKIADPESKNINDYKLKVQTKLDKAYASRADEDFNKKLTDALIDKINPEFPKSMADNYLEHMVNDVMSKNQGQLEKEKVEEAYKPISEQNLKWYLIRNAIIKDRGFEISSEDVSEEINLRKTSNKTNEKEIDKFFKKPSNRDRLSDDLMEKKIVAHLKEFAKIKNVVIKTSDLRKQAEAIK